MNQLWYKIIGCIFFNSHQSFKSSGKMIVKNKKNVMNYSSYESLRMSNKINKDSSINSSL